MNATLLASCAVLCALPFANHIEPAEALLPSPAAASVAPKVASVAPKVASVAPKVASVAPKVEGTTVVIRYDPEAIFLTHELVAPLCSREVELTDASLDGPVGQLVMERMESNELQPRGVFVGRVHVEAAGGVQLSAQRREALLESGLEQLASALANRLTRPRRGQVQKRVVVLERMEAELRATAEHKARELARIDDLATANRELGVAAEALRAREIESRLAQQELLIATAGIREVETKLEAASAAAEQVQKDLERTRALVDQGVTSELDLRAAEQRAHTALSDLQVAAAKVENQRAKVEQRRSQVEAAENELSILDARIVELETRIQALSAAEHPGTIATLRLAHATDNGRLAEIGTELQRARAALATITEVTIERW